MGKIKQNILGAFIVALGLSSMDAGIFLAFGLAPALKFAGFAFCVFGLMVMLIGFASLGPEDKPKNKMP